MPGIMISTLGSLFLLLSLAGVAYMLAAAVLVGRYASHDAAMPFVDPPPVTILKPLHGGELGLYASLETFLLQDYPAPVQIVFGVQDADDPALEDVEALRRTYPSADIALVVNGTRHGSNGKVSNLINMIQAVKHDVLVLSDSDISVGRDYLRRVAGALGESGTGAVTCLYRGEGRSGFWSCMVAMGINYQFLPTTAAAISFGLANPCMGSTIALRRITLAGAGGFQAFANVLADDYEIGRAVRGSGLRTVVVPLLVSHGCEESSFVQAFRHELRWNATILGVDPLGYAGSVVLHPLPIGIIGTAFPGFSPSAWVVAALALAARLALKWRVDRITGSRTGAFWLLPARDLFSFIIFIMAFFTRSVDWRGASYRLAGQGRLSTR